MYFFLNGLLLLDENINLKSIWFYSDCTLFLLKYQIDLYKTSSLLKSPLSSDFFLTFLKIDWLIKDQMVLFGFQRRTIHIETVLFESMEHPPRVVDRQDLIKARWLFRRLKQGRNYTCQIHLLESIDLKLRSVLMKKVERLELR